MYAEVSMGDILFYPTQPKSARLQPNPTQPKATTASYPKPPKPIQPIPNPSGPPNNA